MRRKYLKRILAGILILGLLCGIGIPAFASETEEEPVPVTSEADTSDLEIPESDETDAAGDEEGEDDTALSDEGDIEDADDTALSDEEDPDTHTFSLNDVTAGISAFVKGAGIYEGISLHVSPLSDYGDSNPQQELVSVDIPLSEQNTGCTADLGKLSFSEEGVYEYRIVLGPMNHIRENTQSYLYHVEVGYDGLGALELKDAYYIDEVTGETVDRAEFLVVTNETSSRNSTTLASARRALYGMTLEEKVGQVFMSHYTTTDRISVDTLINTYHPGSVILFKYDVEGNTPSGLQQKLASLQSKSSQGLMIAVDEEGGKVTRVSSVPGFRTGGAFPGPQELKVSGDHAASLDKIKADTKEKASLLLDLGFNMNLAPVADVAGPTGYIYARTYGGDGLENATYVESVVSTAKENGLGTCLKHFPGYGGTSSNTHDGFAVNDLSRSDFDNNDLLPFASGIAAGTDMVLITHNIINCLDTKNPASLSPACYSLVKDEMGFDGIVITDDLAMKAITDFVGSDSPSVRALQAGADMVITPNISTEYPKVKAAVENGSLSMDRLDDAVLKILYWKAEHGLLKESVAEAGFYNASGAKVAEGTFDAMWERAVSAGVGTVRIYKNLSRSTSVSTGTANIRLDLYGFTITNAGGAGSDLFWVNTGGKFTLTDSFGALHETNQEMSGRFHYYSFENDLLSFGIKNDINFKQVDFSQSTAGRILCSGNKAIVMNGGDMVFENGIISNGVDGVVVFSTKNGATGGSFTMTGGAILNSASTWNGGAFNFSTGSDNTTIHLSGGYLVNNSARNNGGAVYTLGKAVIDGDVHILGNTAKVGGGIHAVNIWVGGNSVIGHNTASGESGAFYNGSVLNLHDKACVVSNKATTGGACYVFQAINYISGSVRVFDNTATTGADLYLLNNALFYLKKDNENATIEKDAYIMVSHQSIPSSASAQIVGPYDVPGGVSANIIANDPSNWPNYVLDCFVSSDSDFTSEYQYGEQDSESGVLRYVKGIWFARSVQADLPWGVYLDGIFQDATTTVRYSKNNQRLIFSRIVKTLQKYGFDTDRVHRFEITPNLPNAYDATYFGFKDSNGTVHVYDGSVMYDGDYKILLDTDDDLSNCSVIYLGKSAKPGSYTSKDIQTNYSFRSVTVHDVYSTIWNGNAGDTSARYVPDGSDLTLSLSFYREDWPWSDRRSDDSQYEVQFTTTGSTVTAAITNIHSPVTISNGRNDDIMYNAQYYAYVNQVDLSDIDGSDKIAVIDTSNGNLPDNTLNQVVRYLTVDGSNSNRIKRINRLWQMYEDKRYVYSLNPKLAQIDYLDDDDGYNLTEIWVLKEGLSPISTNEKDFNVYRLSDFPSFKSLHDLHLTTNPDKAGPDTILIKSGTTVRFVYEPVKTEETKQVNFYDYDITDGQLYTMPGNTGNTQIIPSQLKPGPTSLQDTLPFVYTTNLKQGINHDDNYHSSGSKLAFGNANTSTGRQNERWNNLTLNQYNRSPSVYKGCTFGLVEGVAGNAITGYYPVYAPGVSAPYLFNQGSAIGKTVYRNVPLTYDKLGDSFTLTSVGGTNTKNLDRFNHPKTGNTTYTNIWTNNFWPMDDFPSYGTDGHDIKWGDYTKQKTRMFLQSVTPAYNDYNYAQYFTNSDDGMDHNAFFGMNFTINFTVPAGYTGPLDYCFFGDDDMWVFLDDQLVIDIGGVHSSVGEYANLWDYLDESSTEATDHQLTIFYTERGASGSTCWMTFNLPQVQFASETRDDDEGSLELTKEATGMADPDTFYEFEVELFDADGNVPKDDFTYKRLDPDGNIFGYGLIENGKGSFSIRSGGKLIIPYIEDGIRYKITEKTYDCITTFSSRIMDETYESTGAVTEGVIRKNETIYVKCVNAFASGSVMPDAGSNSFLDLISTGLWVTVPGILLLMTMHMYRRKQRHF